MKVLFGISSKLILMVSFIVIAAIGGVVFIATDLFKEESITRVQEMNKDLVERLADETFRGLEKSVDKSKLAFEAMVQGGVLVQNQDAPHLVENILQQNDEILDLGLYRWEQGPSGKYLTEVVYFQKPEVLAEMDIKAEDFKSRVIPRMTSILAKSANTELSIFNSSYLFKKPVLTAFYPVQVPNGAPWVVRMELRQGPFVKAYAKKAQMTAYWVGSDGTLLVHSDPKLGLQNYDFSQMPIVQKARESHLDNQQMEFIDTQGVSYLGAFKKIPVGNSVVIAQIESDVALAAINRVQYRSILVACLAVGFAFLINFSFSQSITSPLSHLYRATEKISQGKFDFRLKPESTDEIGALTFAFSKMAVGLQERDKLKSTFSKFHSKEIADKILKGEVKLGGDKKFATVFFSDIRGFTSMSERMSPDEVVQMLNEYMTEMVRVIKQHKGVVDKYVGDAIMALWGVPESSEQDPQNCLNAALEMREVLIKFNENRKARGKAPIKIGMGIHSGEVLAGNIGSEEHLEYTVIGDTVNQASRIESLNKETDSDILVSDITYNLVKSYYAFGPALPLKVKGKAEKVSVRELIGTKAPDGQIQTVLTVEEQEKIRNKSAGALSHSEVMTENTGAFIGHTETYSGGHLGVHPQVSQQQPITPPPRGNTGVFEMPQHQQQLRAHPQGANWYLVRDPQQPNLVEGPFSQGQLKVMSQMPTFNSSLAYVFKDGDAHMIPIYEMPELSRRTPTPVGVPYGIPLPSPELAGGTPPGSWLVYNVDGSIIGPYNFVQIDQMVQGGDLTRTSYVWQPGLPYWIYLYQIPGFDRRGEAA